MIITVKALAEQISDSDHIEIWENGWYHFMGTGAEFKNWSTLPAYEHGMLKSIGSGQFALTRDLSKKAPSQMCLINIEAVGDEATLDDVADILHMFMFYDYSRDATSIFDGGYLPIDDAHDMMRRLKETEAKVIVLIS